MKLDIREIAPAELHAEMTRLRNDKGMDFLENLIGMDWGEEGGLGVIYQLVNTETLEEEWLKTATTDRTNPELPTVSDLWDIANIYEREVFDFYGIRFVGHPDMRRLFLREDWQGYPLRKDDRPAEENPLNMTNEPLADESDEFDLTSDGRLIAKENVVFGKKDYVLNIGPVHPSTHGVLHLRVSLDGEEVTKVDPVLGYIHRGIEKMAEEQTYPQLLGYTDRLDYFSAIHSRHALCMCIEQALGIEVSDRVKVIRTIMDELQRIDSHIIFFACLANDIGATTAFLYGMRDREKILDIFEETTGGRLIINYNMIGGVAYDLHPNFVRRVKEFIPYMRKNLQEYQDVFGDNVIAHIRMENVGLLTKDQAISYGCTGCSGRAAGWHNDVRKNHPYAAYDRVNFNEITMEKSDSMNRYTERILEIKESLNIIEQLIDNIPEGSYQEKLKPIIKLPEGDYYASVEASRGIFGAFIESRGDKYPYRVHYRSTGLPLVAALEPTCAGGKIADLITITGSLDFVIPDIDR